MRKMLLFLTLIFILRLPVSALEIKAPEIPPAVENLIPEESGSFGQDLLKLLENGFREVFPDLSEAFSACIRLIATVILVSVIQSFSDSVKKAAGFAGTAAVAALLIQNTRTMIHLAADTISELGSYGKMLLPVMTSAMAAQGQITSSAAIYAGSAFFTAILSSLITELLVPMVYLYLALTTANSATGEGILKRLSEIVKGITGWTLKTLLIVFTSYISITGIVSGTTDAAALKATKVTISTVVPVVGGILSDASESVLISAGLLKNAAGIYGILAMLALLVVPFAKIGTQYLLLKLSAAVCSVFGTKLMTELIADYSSALGLLLGMTGASCLMHMISTICFMRGVG